MFGGRDIGEGTMANLWMFDLTKVKQLHSNDSEQDIKLMWHSIETGGVSPGKISHHTSIVLGDKMYLFGGTKGTGESNS